MIFYSKLFIEQMPLPIITSSKTKKMQKDACFKASIQAILLFSIFCTQNRFYFDSLPLSNVSETSYAPPYFHYKHPLKWSIYKRIRIEIRFVKIKTMRNVLEFCKNNIVFIKDHFTFYEYSTNSFRFQFLYTHKDPFAARVT